MPDVFIADVVLDGQLDIIKSNAVKLHACALGALTPNWANVNANTLGSAVISPTDFTHGDRAASGRKTTFGGTSVSITAAGTVDALVFTDGVGVVYVVSTVVANKTVEIGDTLTVPVYDVDLIPDAVAV